MGAVVVPPVHQVGGLYGLPRQLDVLLQLQFLLVLTGDVVHDEDIVLHGSVRVENGRSFAADPLHRRAAGGLVESRLPHDGEIVVGLRLHLLLLFEGLLQFFRNDGILPDGSRSDHLLAVHHAEDPAGTVVDPYQDSFF